MPHIDEKFKDNSPEQTVENIKSILSSIGIELSETWTDSGIEHCYSLRVSADNNFPGTYGKGVTPALARASAYGEFIERLQTGLFLYKYQSLESISGLSIHEYAPDKKYMTKEELVQNGEWMDHVINTYKGRLTREELAEQCAIYAGSEKVLTVPFYSLFEDKYVYLPADFVEHIYCSNGCCTGNSRDEAWIHAMSELLERHANIQMITSGDAAPAIPDEVIQKFDSVYHVITRLRELNYDVTVLDFSGEVDFPIVATRIINKKDGSYRVNVGADPILEIAIKRTLTEIFQSRNIESFAQTLNYGMLKKATDVNKKHNVLNQLETSKGKFTVDFFSEELKAPRKYKPFTDHSKKTNKELLPIVLKIFKDMGRPIYIRNYSFLGFQSYMFVVPGFSESRGLRLNEFLQEYYFADHASKVLRYVEKAGGEDFEEALLFRQIINGAYSRQNNFVYLSGIPFNGGEDSFYLTYIHYAYISYKLNKKEELLHFLSKAAKKCQNQNADYVKCLSSYFEFKNQGMSDEQILCILKKTSPNEAYDRLVAAIENDSFFDGLLMRCNLKHDEECERCMYKDKCRLSSAEAIIQKAGKVYSKFTNGQAREVFKLDFKI